MIDLSSLPARLWRALPLSKGLQLFIMRRIQDEFLVGLTGIIFNDKNEVLICKHTYRNSPSWSLPGGYLKAKEHPKEGLEREIFEETGFIVKVNERLKTRTDRESARIEFCYIGTFQGGEFTPSKEVSQAKFFSFDKLPLISKTQLLMINQATKRPSFMQNFLNRWQKKNL